jgi:hypothetical protein
MSDEVEFCVHSMSYCNIFAGNVHIHSQKVT